MSPNDDNINTDQNNACGLYLALLAQHSALCCHTTQTLWFSSRLVHVMEVYVQATTMASLHDHFSYCNLGIIFQVTIIVSPCTAHHDKRVYSPELTYCGFLCK